MAVNLTKEAVAKICSREVTSEKDLKPVLQVTELKLVKTKQQQQQQSSTSDRYRLVLSDGLQTQQGMLATQKNELVTSGKLQIGSVVQLTQFVCNVIQSRMIVIIIELELIIEKYDIIGVPLPVQRSSGPSQLPTNQYGMGTGNPQSLGGSSLTGDSVVKSNAVGASLQQPGMNPQLDTSYSSNANQERYASRDTSSVYPKVESGTGFAGSVPLSGLSGMQNPSFHNPRPEVSRRSISSNPGPPQPAYQVPPSLYINRGPVARNEAPPRIIPIAALNPYQGRWTIRARVTAKGELRHYSNPRGDGKVFSFDLLDSDGGEIRVTCFNDVADQFFNQIEGGKVYLISKGSLKPAQKTFNHLRNDHEIFLDSTSTVQLCFDDDNKIPQQQFHFRPISDVEGMENNSVVDIIGVVSFISPAASIMRKNGSETHKRTLQLKDMSGRSVELTLWGNFCNSEGQRLQAMCDSGLFPVLAVKSGRVSDFNGKGVGTISMSQLFIEPDIPEACHLKEWFNKEGKNTPSVSISREISNVGKTDVRKTISQIKDEKLGTSEKPDWITICATIIYIKLDNFCYTACPLMIGDRPCNKKVTNNGDGKWRCDRCDVSVDECDYRYILQFQIEDHTGLTWVTAFQDSGEEIMGISAKELHNLKFENQDDERFTEIIRNILFSKYIFKLKVKEETFSDEQRVKATAVKAERVSYSSESRFLLGFIDRVKTGNFGSFFSKPVSTPNPAMNRIEIGGVGGRQPTGPVTSYVGNTANANQVNLYSGSTVPATSGPGTYLCCNSCGATGHSSYNCPSIMSSPRQPIGGGYVNRVPSGIGSAKCFKCHQIGHFAKDCSSMSSVPPAYGSSGISSAGYGGFMR